MIDVYVRSNGTIAYFDVYEAGTQNKVGRSGTTEYPELQYITVDNLTKPADVFDFKVVKLVRGQEEIQVCLDRCNIECEQDPYNGCIEECNLGCYSTANNENRTAFLEFDYIHDGAINATFSNGLVVYGQSTINNPYFKLWNSSNDFSAS